MTSSTAADSSPADSTYRLVVSREFNAPRERVWRAWTDPAQMRRWLDFGEDMRLESVQADLRAGGRFRIQIRRADGEYYTAAGSYLVVQPPERVVYTWDWEKDGAGGEFGELEGRETQVTVEFHARGPRTEMVLTHEKFTTPESRDNHEKGWTVWAERLAQYVEAGGAES